MLKKSISYEDFNGETVTEDFYFHLSKAELVELEMSHDGGMSSALERIVAAKDGKGIITEFKNIILTAYGKRSDDGRRFTKNQTLREEFESTEAYSSLFMELVTDTDAAIEFINGIVPKGMVEEAAKLVEADNKPSVPAITVVPNPEVVSKASTENMDPEQLRELAFRIASGAVVLGD